LSKYGTLIWIFKKWHDRAWTVLLWFRIGPGGGNCECGSEQSGSTGCGECLDQLGGHVGFSGRTYSTGLVN